jgi:hypothetical protein
MGYRLEVAEVEPKYTICGGKLYGYYGLSEAGSGIEELESWKWLKEQGIITGDELWTYGCSIDVVLSADDFRQFFALYRKDYEKITGEPLDYGPEELASIANDKDKLLSWF